MPRRTTRGSIAKASAKAKKNNTTTNLRKKQASEALLDISDEASVESIIEVVTTPTKSKKKTRGYIARQLVNKAANISLSPNVNISKKQIGEDLLDTSDEESVKSIVEKTTPTTPSSSSKETASTTTSPSSISSMSTMVSWIYNYFLTSLIIILTSLSLML